MPLAVSRGRLSFCISEYIFCQLIRISLQAMEHLAGIHNLNKRLGKPEEVAETIVFQASTAVEMINGACLPIDGGSSIA